MTLLDSINQLAGELQRAYRKPTSQARKRIPALKKELEHLWALRRAERAGEYESWYAYEDILSRPHMADFAAPHFTTYRQLDEDDNRYKRVSLPVVDATTAKLARRRCTLRDTILVAAPAEAGC